MNDEVRGSIDRVTPELLARYNRPGPRYTSYPTAPVWTAEVNADEYGRRLARADRESTGAPFSLYFHIPFCEGLCFYCGCNVVVTRNHAVVGPYLNRVERELELVAARVPNRRTVSQLHLGGGTPTYLSPAELERLHRTVRSHFDILPDAEVALEVDPRVTTREHLATLADLGFNRISLGVQDFSPQVQQAVHRIQSEEETRAVVDAARELGFSSVNVDLIYGLPDQDRQGFAKTLDVILDFLPDRVAVFSYAHVPWMRPAQASFEKKGHDLPDTELKFAIFQDAWDRFTGAGYGQIGMDHFALAGDELSRAQRGGYLFRNFQGYTVRPAPDSLAFGVTGISDVASCYVQNARTIDEYYQSLDEGLLPIIRGCDVTPEDALRREVIHGLLCNFTLDTDVVAKNHGIDFAAHFKTELCELDAFIADDLVNLTKDRIDVTPLGRFFIRNICMVFDSYLKKMDDRPTFSRTV